MTNEPPQWALDKAAKISGWKSWEGVESRNFPMLKEAIKAHATTIAKYETEPVDPVLAKAREICKGHWPILYDAFGDESREIQAIMEALRLPAMGKSDAR
jgi:hypothetical protein